MSDRSRLGSAISLLAASVLAVQLFAPVTASASALSVESRAAASNGLLLYGGWRFGTIDGEHVTSVKPAVVGAQANPLALSPAGDQFAYVVSKDFLNESLRTFARDGTDRLVVHMPGQSIGAFDWAPDGSAIAFTATRVVDGIEQSGLYRVPASGGSPVQLVAGTREVSFFQNSLAADLSWSSRGEIAFLALRCLDECQYSGVDVYTVPAVGGQVERFTPTGSCGAPPAQTPCFSYTSVDWSPDGSALAVTYNASPGGWSEPQATHVGFVHRGSSTPTSLHGIGEPYTSSDLNGDYCCGMFRTARWSPDQRQIVYSFGFTRFHQLASESYVISAGGGTPRLVNGSEEVQDWQACPGGRCATWAALPETARCTPPQPGEPAKKDYLYTRVEGTSRWNVAVGPDVRIASFDIGARWCTTPNGPGFRGPINVWADVNARWVIQGVLENLGFILRAKDPTVTMKTTSAKVKGRVVVDIAPLKVALNVVPVGRLLDRVSSHIDDCFRQIGSGIDPGVATRELAERLLPLAKKIREEVKYRLRTQLDRLPGNTTILAIKLSNAWMRKTDRAAAVMVDYIVDKVKLGAVTVTQSAKLTVDALTWAFGSFSVTLWRPVVRIELRNSGRPVIERHSEVFPGMKDRWKDRTVT